LWKEVGEELDFITGKIATEAKQQFERRIYPET
jgi:hypothetical protein